jgi:uncharacterized protein (DUF983 family)
VPASLAPGIGKYPGGRVSGLTTVAEHEVLKFGLAVPALHVHSYVAHTNGARNASAGRMRPSLSRALRLMWRALRLRCPNCGRGRLLVSWFRLRDRCPVCQVWLEREEGYFVGAMALNIVIAEFLPFGAAVVIILLAWPNPPWKMLQIAVPVAMGVTPVVLFPFSRMVWLALDWTFRPPSRDNRPDHPRPGAA